MIKIVAFDLDDTLYSEIDYVKSGFNAVSLLMKKQFGINNFYKELVKTFQASERKKVFNVTLKRLGIKYNDSLIQEMVDQYRTHIPNIQPYQDVLPSLMFLKQKYTLVLITDGYLEAQKHKVHSLKIESFFKKIIYTDKHGRNYWKPNKSAFKLVMEIFSVKGYECAYIGDNISKDFLAPNQLGWLTIQIFREDGIYVNTNINFSNKEFIPKIKIKSLIELKEIIH